MDQGIRELINCWIKELGGLEIAGLSNRGINKLLEQGIKGSINYWISELGSQYFAESGN